MSPIVHTPRGERLTLETDPRGEPPGPVQRRIAGDDERGGFVSRRPADGVLARAPRRLITLADPPVTSAQPEEEEPMAIDAAPETGELNEDTLLALDIALREAISAHDGIRAVADAQTRWIAAQKALELAMRRTGLVGVAPADLPRSFTDAVREVYREEGLNLPENGQRTANYSKDLPVPAYTPPASIDEVVERREAREGPGSRLAIDAGDDAPQRYAEPADDAPEVVTQPSKAHAAVETKQDRILALVIPTGGDVREIAFRRGTTPANVTATLHNAGKRRRLTAEMIALLPAAFAKYSAAEA